MSRFSIKYNIGIQFFFKHKRRLNFVFCLNVEDKNIGLKIVNSTVDFDILSKRKHSRKTADYLKSFDNIADGFSKVGKVAGFAGGVLDAIDIGSTI